MATASRGIHSGSRADVYWGVQSPAGSQKSPEPYGRRENQLLSLPLGLPLDCIRARYLTAPLFRRTTRSVGARQWVYPTHQKRLTHQAATISTHTTSPAHLSTRRSRDRLGVMSGFRTPDTAPRCFW